MDIISHLTRTVSPAVLADDHSPAKQNLLEQFYAIFAARLANNDTYSRFANENIAQTLLKEWTHFRDLVDTIEPQGDIGGYMLYRDYQDMTLLWRTSNDTIENEAIRFFMMRADGSVFAVTYHKSDIINPGKTVLRRFVGTEPVGWVEHTVDFNTGKYLGSSGEAATLTSSEKKMMKEWKITHF